MRTPIVLITGFLGSGKTTLLRRLAADARRRRLFIVNEFSSVNVDGHLVREAGASDVLEVAGGSIFCRCKVTEFLETLRRAQERILAADIAEVVIETSGMADPRAMETLLQETEWARDYRLAGVITVVDPDRFLKLAGLLPVIEAQVGAADLVLLNHADRYPDAHLQDAEFALRRLAPSATILRTTHCRVPSEVLSFPLVRSGMPQGAVTAGDPHFATLALSPADLPTPALLAHRLEALRPHIFRVKGIVRRAEGSVEAWEDVGERLVGRPVSPSTPETPLVIICRRGMEEEVRRVLTQPP